VSKTRVEDDMVQATRFISATETSISWESGHSGFLSSYVGDQKRDHESFAAEGFAALALADREIAENRRVNCPIVRPAASFAGGASFDRVCVLIHGLNERSWDKYVSWAQAIADRALCPVVLFPIAFHMDRSPAAWADFGIMRGVSKERNARIGGLKQSSMANAAISERLDEAPGRFFLSGLMAAHDLGDLARSLKEGEVPGISAGARLGFFGYSIGTYLLQCLSLADEGFALAGKRFLFCGGPFLSAMRPVSKYIMDSKAHERLLDFWVYALADELRKDAELAALIDTPEGRAYCAMVDPRHPQMGRKEFFSNGETQVASLSGDDVMPRQAILDFFEGTGVRPLFIDLPPVCTHIAPFNPLGGEEVSPAFDRLFSEAAEHLFG
jgi:hypothetical protein